MMVSTSLDILEDSLIKKIEVMEKIEELNNKQEEILKNPELVDDKEFDETLDEKGELIDKLLHLDDGFQSLFDEVKASLQENKMAHKDQIRRMQDHIKTITSKSASIEVKERRNKKLAEEYFSAARRKMNYSRKTSAAAFNYYRTMNNFKDIPPQFMDNKN